jgi:hypothetical protein
MDELADAILDRSGCGGSYKSARSTRVNCNSRKINRQVPPAREVCSGEEASLIEARRSLEHGPDVSTFMETG